MTTTPETTQSTSNLVRSIADAGRMAVMYGEMLVGDISDAQFTEMPFPTMNHPAFLIGHLSIYPAKLFGMLGQPDKADVRDGYEELFAAGVECVADASRYPSKDAIVEYYVTGYAQVIDALESVDDQVLGQPNPVEGMLKERLPTLGGMVNFMLNSHPMVHHGQLSAWRRAVGLPSVM